jgi:hypothetical protein
MIQVRLAVGRLPLEEKTVVRIHDLEPSSNQISKEIKI